MATNVLILTVLTLMQRAEALLIDSQYMNVEKGANVSTYDSILSGISMIKCADACLRKGRDDKCNLAGYHKGSRTCLLSLDTGADVIHVPDRNYVVIGVDTTESSSPSVNETTLSQWAMAVVDVSSAKSGFGGSEILGPNDVYPGYGGYGSWCGASQNQQEFIEIQFATPVNVTSIDIYETWRGGSLQAIKCYQSGVYVNLWTTSTTVRIVESRIFSPTLNGSCFSNQILLETNGGGGWADYDAVKLNGIA